MTSPTQAVQRAISQAQTPPCPLCGSPSRSGYQLKHAQTARCQAPACRLEFAWPQLNDHDLAAAYTGIYYPANASAAPELENTPYEDAGILLDHIAANSRPLQGRLLLDYGCGRGTLLKAALDRGADAVGIELDDVARKQAQELTGGRVFADVVALRAALPESRFDTVVLCTVIEHLREPWRELAVLRELMTPDGTIFVTTANAACLKSRLRLGDWDQRTNPTHFYYLDDRSMKAVLRRAGFPSVWQMPPIVTYTSHGVLRRSLQRVLGALGLQGSIIHAASSSMNQR